MFEGGLRREIRERVSIMRLALVDKVDDVAMIVEKEHLSSRPSQPQGPWKRIGRSHLKGKAVLKDQV